MGFLHTYGRFFALAIGIVVVALMCLVLCRKPCRRCNLRDACDMANLVGNDD